MTQVITPMSLFADSDAEAARMDAIDQLHSATAIYTAEGIVDEMLNLLNWPVGDARLIDPSCGDGIFLGRALTKALGRRDYQDESLPGIIEGWEIHPHACAQARARIAAVLVAHGRTGETATRLAEKIVLNRDFLTDAPSVPTALAFPFHGDRRMRLPTNKTFIYNTQSILNCFRYSF